MLETILSGGWGWLAGVGGVIAALLAAWFGGKKVATVQTQAKADVIAAQKEAESVKASSDAQQKVTKEVNNVRENVARIGDNDVDDQLRNKWKRS